MLVTEAEAQELGGIIRDERPHGPFLTGIHRVLGPVVAEAQEPLRELTVSEGSHIRADIEALAVSAPLFVVVPVGVGDYYAAQRHQVLPVSGEERPLPAGGRVLVLHVEADDVALLLLGCLAGGDGGPELDGAEGAEVDEGAETTGGERGPEGVPAERDLVLTVEDAAENLDIERQLGYPCRLESVLAEPLGAEELHEHV